MPCIRSLNDCRGRFSLVLHVLSQNNSIFECFFGKIAHVNDIMLATELQCSATKTVNFFLTNSWLRWLSKAVISFLIWSLLLWFHAVRFEKVHR